MNQEGRFLYRNHRDELRLAKIDMSTIKTWIGSTEYYPEPQWLMTAYDLDRKAERTYALQAVSKWLGPEPQWYEQIKYNSHGAALDVQHWVAAQVPSFFMTLSVTKEGEDTYRWVFDDESGISATLAEAQAVVWNRWLAL